MGHGGGDRDAGGLKDLAGTAGRRGPNPESLPVLLDINVREPVEIGDVKPLFSEMKVYDRRQDHDKTLFRQLYEMLVGGVAGLLKNHERGEVATVATVSGRIDQPQTSGWQIALRLVGNAFFRSILPGFDLELRRPVPKQKAP